MLKKLFSPVSLVVSFVMLSFVILVGVASRDADAIPTFAKKYKTTCSTCHYAFPKLNAFGKAFHNNGLRFPGDDAESSKDEPVSLGADAYKEVFPDAIWPSDIPGMSTVSFHLFSRAHLKTTPEGKEVVNLSFEFPHEAELFFTGTLGESFAFFGEIEWEHADEIAYEYNLQYRYRPYLQVKAGNVEPGPFHDGHRLTKSHYNYVDFKVPGAGGETRWRKISTSGLEIFGAGNGPDNKGGFTYKAGVINGQSQPSNDDINDAKDLYARATFKLGGLGEIGGTGAEASDTDAAWRDDSIRIGAYGYLGKALYEKDDKTWENSHQIFGVDIDAWYNRFNLFGTFLLRKDDDPTGDGKTENNAAAALGELDVVVFPWLIGLVRFEWTDANTDDEANKDGDDPTAKITLIPGVVALARANIKLSVDAQIPLDNISEDKNGTAITAQFNVGF